MKREEIIFKKDYVLDKLHYDRSWNKNDADYIHIECKISSVDDGDGGAEYCLVIQRSSDDKYFCCEYNDWDLDDDYNDFEFEEVFPFKQTITIYR